MKKKRTIALVAVFLLAGAIWLFAADNDVTMFQIDGTDLKDVNLPAVTDGLIGFDGSDNLAVKAPGAFNQTPWVADIDGDGFDLRDLSNLEFRTTTGAPAGTVQAIYADAGGINLNVPTADLFDILVNNVTQMTVSVSAVDLQGNTLTDVLDITSITSLNGVAIANYILATDNLGALAATTSAQFAGVISNATGTGLVPLATNPTFTGLTATGTMDLSGGTFDVTLNAAVDALNFDSNTLSIDASSNRVGIGTAAPAGTLHVRTAASGGGPSGSADDLIVENNGNSGISILSANNSAGNLFFGSPSDSIGAQVSWNHDDDIMTVGTVNTDAILDFRTANNVVAVTIDASQNVGIGTTGPNSKLDVDGAISGTDDATTLGVAATTFAVTSNFATITGDGGGNTIATITGGVVGQQLILLFVDTNVTITDDDTHAADSLDLSAAFTSTDDATISFIQNGTSWYETSRSVNSP